MSAVPFHTVRCYACDATACGVRDRRPEGGVVEAACARHADPAIKSYAACVFCSGARPTLTIDGDFARKRRRPRLKIEWHPGICEWQCSNFTNCDAAIERLPARKGRLNA